MRDMNEECRLGKDLLATVLEVTEDPEQLEHYNSVLAMPGIDGALYILYENKSEFKGHPRPLLQSAFMLGYYLNESLHKTSKLWEAGPPEDPV